MQHRGTKRSRLRGTHGYEWYDHRTGAINLCHLAADATRTDPPPKFAEPPDWIRELPSELRGAGPLDLAKLDAWARRLFVHSGG